MSTEAELWAMQQNCPSPLAKLLLWRIAVGIGESGRQKFDHPLLERFAGCGYAPLFEAMGDLEAAGLIQNFGSVGDYGVDLALPWYRKPDPRELPKRNLQSVQRIREGLIRLQDGLCWYCGRSLDQCRGTPHVEHQTPLSRGGADAFHNLVMACPRCNTDKGDLTLDEYREVVQAREAQRDPAPGIVDDAGRFHGERWA
jgi:hypothetical protein